MDLPLIVALITFLAVMLTSAAVFFFLNSRESVQAWRRRAEATASIGKLEAAPVGLIEEFKAQLQALLVWLSRFNQPSNVEQVRATRRMLVTAGYRSAKAPIFFLGARLLLAIVVVIPLAMIPPSYWVSHTVNNLILLYVVGAACGYYAPVVWLRRAIPFERTRFNGPSQMHSTSWSFVWKLGLDWTRRLVEWVRKSHAPTQN